MVTKEELFSIPLPEKTESYIPIANKDVVNTVLTIAQDHNYTPISEVYKLGNNSNVMSGLINFKGTDSDIGMSIGILNSYDKSKKLSVGSGGSVFVCTNGMFKADLIEMRKHTGNVREEMERIILNQVLHMQEEYDKLVTFKNLTKQVQIDKLTISHLLGEMYYQEDMLKVTQMSIIKKSMNEEPFGMSGKTISMWNFYNWITEALKTEHASNFLTSHIQIHNYIDRKVTDLYAFADELLKQENNDTNS